MRLHDEPRVQHVNVYDDSRTEYLALSLSLSRSPAFFLSFFLSLLHLLPRVCARPASSRDTLENLPFLSSSAFLVRCVQGSSVHSRSRRGKSCPKVFCFGFNEIIPTAAQSRRLFPSCTAEGWPSKARAVPCWPAFKTAAREQFYVRRECTRVTPRRESARHFFLVVCHRDAGTCLFRCF